MDVSIIIVNWNSAAFVGKCISSIIAQTCHLEYEIIVVDSASYDGCGEMLARDFPQVVFIQSKENVGFAKANNMAFAHARGRMLLLLNPDTELAGPTIEIMASQLESLQDAGLAGCPLVNTDSTLQTSCVQAFPTILNQLIGLDFLITRFPRCPIWGKAPLFSSSERPAEVDAVSGACMLLPREVFAEVGLFSPEFFMYSEDIDLCLKVRNSGRKVYYIPKATVVHHGGKSAGTSSGKFSNVMFVESLWRYLRKNRGRAYGVFYRVSIGSAAVVRLGFILLGWSLGGMIFNRARLEKARAKWKNILSWSLGFENWVVRYN